MTSPVPRLVVAIKELVPGDSGGSTALSGGCMVGGGTYSGCGMVDRHFKSICMIWLKLGRSFGSSFQQEVTIGAKSAGRFSALGRKFCINSVKRKKEKDGYITIISHGFTVTMHEFIQSKRGKTTIRTSNVTHKSAAISIFWKFYNLHNREIPPILL